MKHKNELLQLKIHELSFAVKRLEIHQKINKEAMFQFSKSFKNFIDEVEDSTSKHKLKQIAGLAGESEKRMTKTAKRAKQQRQYKRGKNKIEQEVQLPPDIPVKPVPDEYKKLYRDIAKKTHPDKIGDDKEKSKILQEVNNAVSEEEYFKLIECALLLGIEIPEEVPFEPEQVNKKITDANKKIEQITKSVAWEWYHLPEQSDKTRLIEGYAAYLLKSK